MERLFEEAASLAGVGAAGAFTAGSWVAGLGEVCAGWTGLAESAAELELLAAC